ncbi:hypothetical protein CSW58_06980 [Caulobacter sp. B11]|uniref:hypothetical protein n=1 Tax=Caulobacter sp. B11 TaxID=2048899 RepID=UPI000C12A304|nr:hypothetical protein [Caulobacter sp. B11]PHY13259.1 hypothetical protein CSW58_06980 [Caulobacter sp. B11]
MLALLTTAALAASVLTSGPAALAPAFGNTVVSTYPDGRQARLWLNRDGGYRATGRRGKASSGTWSLKGGKVCLKQRKPIAAPITFCAPYRSGGVGTRWTGKAVTGETIQIALVAGR